VILYDDFELFVSWLNLYVRSDSSSLALRELLRRGTPDRKAAFLHFFSKTPANSDKVDCRPYL